MRITVRPAVDADVDRLLDLWWDLGDVGHAADPRYRVRVDAGAIARDVIATRWLPDADHHVVVAVRAIAWSGS